MPATTVKHLAAIGIITSPPTRPELRAQQREPRDTGCQPGDHADGAIRQLNIKTYCLAQKPECLLLDEPSASLDLRHRVALMRTLTRLRDNLDLSICVVTHDLHLIDGAFDRVLALSDGRLVVDDRPERVLNDLALARVYEDPSIRTKTVEGRTLVWCE